MKPIFRTITCAFVVMLSFQAWADRVVPLSLPEITTAAGTIFEGECIDLKSGVDDQSGLLATWYTFKVEHAIKGELGETFTFKQYGGSDGDRTIVSPSAKYEKGQKVVLFLYGTSRLGFCSAVGLTQGKFRVVKHPKTKQTIVTNGMPAAVLFKDTPYLPAAYDGQGRQLQGVKRLQAKQLDHDGFLDIVREIIETTKKDAKKE